MSKTIKFEGVTVLNVRLTTITTKNQMQHTKAYIDFRDDRMQLFEGQAFGQDKVNDLALHVGKVYDLYTVLDPRPFGGEVKYILTVYKAEEVQQVSVQVNNAEEF